LPNRCGATDWARGYTSLDKEFQQIVRDAKVGKGEAGQGIKPVPVERKSIAREGCPNPQNTSSLMPYRFGKLHLSLNQRARFSSIPARSASKDRQNPSLALRAGVAESRTVVQTDKGQHLGTGQNRQRAYPNTPRLDDHDGALEQIGFDSRQVGDQQGRLSLPIDPPKSGKIAVKVINHYGDEVLKVFPVGKAVASRSNPPALVTSALPKRFMRADCVEKRSGGCLYGYAQAHRHVGGCVHQPRPDDGTRLDPNPAPQQRAREDDRENAPQLGHDRQDEQVGN
jgi:hypothetical protein